MMRFSDRRAAGRSLATAVSAQLARVPTRARSAPLVLGLPRGGVPVAYEVALALNAPLDVFVVRKLGVPGHTELAMGALGQDGAVVLDHALIERLSVSDAELAETLERERAELARRERAFRRGRAPLDVRGRTAIVVDDGLATGWTMRAAVRGVRQLGPARIIVAVPVAAASTYTLLQREADEVVCLHTPEPFTAVGLWYEDFTQTPDEDVRDLLSAAGRRAFEHEDARATLR